MAVQVVHWIIGSSGDWGDATQWSTGAVPGGNDDVAIDSSGTYTVTATDQAADQIEIASGAMLSIEGNFTLANGTMDNGNQGEILVDPTAQLIVGVAIDNSGTIVLDSDSSGGIGRGSSLQIVGNVSLIGFGQLTLGGTAPSADGINSNGAAATLENVTNTIAGAGTIGDGDLVFLNDAGGTVEATSSTLFIGAATFTNAGKLWAMGGAYMQILGTFTNLSGGTLSGGTYESDTNSNIFLPGSSAAITTDDANVILSGLSSTLKSGPFIDIDSTLTTITAAGRLELDSGRVFSDPGALDDFGSIALGGGTLSAASLAIEPGAGLIGFGAANSPTANSGTIESKGGTLDLVGPISGAGRLVIDDGSTLELTAGSGDAVTFGQRGPFFTPHGILLLDNPAAFAASGAAITGLQLGDTIDFAATAVTSAVLDDTTLTVGISGAPDLVFHNVTGAGGATLVHGTFQIESDNNNGTALVLATGTPGDSWVGPPSKRPGVIRGGNWNTAADWSAGVPTSTSDVVLKASAAPYTVIVDNASGSHGGTTIGALIINGPDGAARATATLRVTAGTFTVEGDSSNAGILAAAGSGMLTLMRPLTNTGIVSAATPGATINLDYGSISGGTIYIASGATIEATSGRIASRLPGSPYAISNSTVVDLGTLEAIDGSLLPLGPNTTINAHGGLIVANGGENIGAGGGFPRRLPFPSVVVLAGATINGGTLEVLGRIVERGVIQTATGTTSTLDGTTIANGTTVNVLDDSTLVLKRLITNKGAIQLNASGDRAMLAVANNVFLRGGGGVALTDNAANIIAASGATRQSPFTLTNVDNTIRGAGAIGNGDATLKFNNQVGGVVAAAGINALTIDTGNAVMNGGLLDATGLFGATGTLVIDDTVTNVANGVIAANGGNVTIDGNLQGAGKAEIFSGSRMELGGAHNTGAVSFQNDSGDTGLLALDHSTKIGVASGFKGTIAGFYSDGIDSDTLDLKDINFASGVTWSFTERRSATTPDGILTVRDGVGDTANLILLGQYLAAGQSASSTSSTLFSLAADASSGTVVTTSFHHA